MKVWNAGDFILHTDLNANFASVGSGSSGTTLNVASYAQAGDADSTLAFTRAIAAAQALNAPVEIRVPAGVYSISAAITATLTGAQAITLAGPSAGVATIRQTADANGIAVIINNYGPAFYLGGAFNVRGLTFQMAATASTTRTALSITTSSVTGYTGVPLTVDDVTFISSSSGSAWGTGLNIGEFGNVAYLSRISAIFVGATTGTAINIAGNASSYTASAFLRDVTVIGGAVGVNLGDYLQGIHLTNVNTVQTRIALNCVPNNGLNVEIQITGCYLDGRCVFTPGGTAAIQSVKVVNTYFDSDLMLTGDRQVLFTAVPILLIAGCTFHGRGSAVTGVFGLSIVGLAGDSAPVNQTYLTNLSNNQFVSYAGGGTGLSIAATVFNLFASGNQFIANSNDVADAGTNSSWNNTSISGGVAHSGLATSIPTNAAVSYGPMVFNGSVAAVGTGGGYFTTGGLGVWNHGAPVAQPARAVTLADCIAVLAAYGFTA